MQWSGAVFPFGFGVEPTWSWHLFLGVDSPFFSTIVLFKNQLFMWGSDGFLEKTTKKNGEVSPRLSP